MKMENIFSQGLSDIKHKTNMALDRLEAYYGITYGAFHLLYILIKYRKDIYDKFKSDKTP